MVTVFDNKQEKMDDEFETRASRAYEYSTEQTQSNNLNWENFIIGREN